MLTPNQEKALEFIKHNPDMLPSDFPLYRELALLVRDLRRGQKAVQTTKAASEQRAAIYRRMDSIIELLGMGERE